MALYKLDNGRITAVFDSTGGEPVSLSLRGAGKSDEYLWYGDPAYWESRAPLLFPFVGRLRGGVYSHNGRTYEMCIHGFARYCQAEAGQTEHGITFTMRDTAQTRLSYPFSFELQRAFRIEGTTLFSDVTVKNTGGEPLPFSLGEHPGFLVPPGGGDFSDTRLFLECSAPPRRMLLSPSLFMSGESEPFELSDGGEVPLSRAVFDDDAVILTGVTAAKLENSVTHRCVTLRCPDATYFGFWQPDHSDAPFICIEPWQGLPSFDAPAGSPADTTRTKPGLIHLQPGDIYRYSYNVTIQ